MEKDIKITQVAEKDKEVFATLASIVKDDKGVYLYRKSEKISKAFFLLTHHLDETSSIKKSIRDGALSLLDTAQVFLSPKSKISPDYASKVVLNITALVSLSDIALSSHYISHTNWNIIMHQIQLFISEVNEHMTATTKDTSLIPSTLFEVTYIDSRVESRDSSQYTEKDMAPSTSVPTIYRHHTAPNTLKSTQKKSTPQQHARVVDSDESNERKNQRQTTIIETIRQRGELSIKDLTSVIKGCSEKTIQRELVSLVSKGALLKTGERRWSRYSVAS